MLQLYNFSHKSPSNLLKQRLFSNTLMKKERSQSQPKSKVLNISVQCATAVTWAAEKKKKKSYSFREEQLF